MDPFLVSRFFFRAVLFFFFVSPVKRYGSLWGFVSPVTGTILQEGEGGIRETNPPGSMQEAGEAGMPWTLSALLGNQTA